jgi:type IV pilus assembly protein PilB
VKDAALLDRDRRLLEELRSCPHISEADLIHIEGRVRESEVTVLDALAALNLDSNPEIGEIVASVLDVVYIDIDHFEVDREDLEAISSETAHRYRVVPLFHMDDSLTVGMADPTNATSIDAIREETSLEIKACLVSRDGLQKALGRYYPETEGNLSEIISDIDASQFQIMDLEGSPETDTSELAPVARAFSEILTRAVRARASDIHIEPGKDVVQIRYRIDGALHDILELPAFIARPLVSHLKVLCSLQITETRRPQDGRYQASVDRREIDTRVSIVPSVLGESVVIRLLGGTSLISRLEDIGFSHEGYKAIERMLRSPWGMVLASGPTGSGKTTTLFTLLERVKSREKKVITIEDPVEYKLNDIRQIQVNPDVGLTFATGLRSILRQDPDIVLVGEIRDEETAGIATQAALTGHLVLSTLHTNDAAGAAVRLAEMGVRPYLIASSLTGVIGQRLVRRICPHCITESVEDSLRMSELGLALKEGEVTYVGAGCAHCLGTGYAGRTAVAEVLVATEEIRRLITASASVDEIRNAAQKEGMVTLVDTGIQKVLSGSTTLSEMTRAVGLGFEKWEPVEI